MKNDLQVAASRSGVLLSYTRRAIRERQLVVTTFAAEVAERYLARHEVHERVVKFREPVGDTGQLMEAMRHNTQIVDRYIKGVVRAFPADLEEAWTDALPPAYRLPCRRELVRRLGFLGALVRPAGECAHVAMADVMHEFAEFVAVAGAALRDGKVTAEERAAVLREITDAQAALESYRHQMTSGTDGAGRVVELSPQERAR